MRPLALAPLDTWFFRDSRPFTGGGLDVSAVFPPFPPTVVGCARAAIARANGWNGVGRWPAEFNDVLGDGPENLGALSFTGPFLLMDGRPYFPLPRHVVGSREEQQGEWTPRALLRPGRPIRCDLGRARLPETTQDRWKPADDLWLPAKALQETLNGHMPARGDLIPAACLWSVEPRIGLARDPERHTAEEGQLYSARHVRPWRNVAVGLLVDGLPNDWKWPVGSVAGFGGESRMAALESWRPDFDFRPPLQKIAAAGRFVLAALTPLAMSGEVIMGRGKIQELGRVSIVSACLERPVRIGGWNSIQRRPEPLISCLRPGSVLFCQADDPAGAAQAIADSTTANRGLVKIGCGTETGYGLAAVGTWEDNTA